MAISQDIHQSSVTKINMKIIHLKCHQNLHWANELRNIFNCMCTLSVEKWQKCKYCFQNWIQHHKEPTCSVGLGSRNQLPGSSRGPCEIPGRSPVIKWCSLACKQRNRTWQQQWWGVNKRPIFIYDLGRYCTMLDDVTYFLGLFSKTIAIWLIFSINSSICIAITIQYP